MSYTALLQCSSTLTDYAGSLFQEIENCRSVLSEKITATSAFIRGHPLPHAQGGPGGHGDNIIGGGPFLQHGDEFKHGKESLEDDFRFKYLCQCHTNTNVSVAMFSSGFVFNAIIHCQRLTDRQQLHCIILCPIRKGKKNNWDQ